MAVLCGGFWNSNAFGQTAVWEQKFEIFDTTCEPNGSGPPIIEFAAGPSGELYFSEPGSLYRSTDGGATWQSSQFDLVHIEGILPLSAGNLLIGLYGDNGIYKVAEHGDSWSQTNVTEGVWELFANDDHSLLLAIAAGGGLYVSTDQGETWELTQPEWDVSAVHVGPDGRIYLLAEDTYVSDDGFSWTQLLSSRFPFPSGTANILLATDTDGVYRSENNGQTWGLTLRLNEPALLRNKKGVLIAISREREVHLSEDDGESWRTMISASPLPCGARSTVAVDDNGHLWLGSNVGVIFRSSQTTHVASEESVVLPDEPFLEVYPNPTRSTINIVFKHDNDSAAWLRVFDLLGREVHSIRTDLGGFVESRLSWHTVNFPAGVYLVRLETDSFVIAQHVTVVH